MKKSFINYYSIIILLFYVIYNCILSTIKIGGLLYQIFMITIIIANIIALLKFNKQIKFKKTCFIVFFITFVFGKNIFQLLFCLSSIITICILEYSSKSIFFKIISTIISILFLIISLFFFLILGTKDRGIIGIDEYQHYICENHYEAYAFSTGASSNFHYYVGKYYEIIKPELLYIRYSRHNSTSKEDYINTVKKYNGKLKDEKYYDPKMMIN